MRVAIYARVSTRDQDAGNQLVRLREFAELQGWTIAHEYVEQESGGKAEREQFLAMMAAASLREFDLVLFWALDRLSREGVYETLTYLQRLTGYGVGWRSLTEQYLDSTGIFRDAVIAILAAVAKQERVRIRERTMAGLARARAKRGLAADARLGGRPRVEERDPRLELRVAELVADGASVRRVMRECGISSHSALRLVRAARSTGATA